MFKVYANIVNETQKVFSRKMTLAFLLLTILLPIVSALAFSYVQRNTAIQVVSGDNFALSILWIFTTLFLPLFVMMLAMDLFVGEIADRSIKILLVRPISRFKVFLSKTIVIAFFTGGSLGVLYIASILSGGILLKEWSAIDLLRNLVTYAVAVVPMVVLGTFAVFIGQFFGSVSGGFASCMVFYAIAKVLPFFFPSMGAFLFTTYMDWQSLSLATTGLLLSSFILLFTLGFYLFDKKEL